MSAWDSGYLGEDDLGEDAVTFLTSQNLEPWLRALYVRDGGNVPDCVTRELDGTIVVEEG